MRAVGQVPLATQKCYVVVLMKQRAGCPKFWAWFHLKCAETAVHVRDELFPPQYHSVWGLVLADGDMGQLDAVADPTVKQAYISRRLHVRAWRRWPCVSFHRSR